MFQPWIWVTRGEEFVLRPDCPHHIKSLNTMFTLTVVPIRIMKSGWCRYEKSNLPTGLQRVRECTTVTSLSLRTNQENSNVPFSWLSMFMNFNLNEYRFRLSSWPSRYSQVLWQRWDVGKIPKPCFVQLLMKWWLLKLVDQSGYQVKAALGKRNSFYHPAWLLASEHFDLKYIGADGEEHHQLWHTSGVISTMERFTAILIS